MLVLGAAKTADNDHGDSSQERATYSQPSTVAKTQGSDRQAVASAPRSGF